MNRYSSHQRLIKGSEDGYCLIYSSIHIWSSKKNCCGSFISLSYSENNEYSLTDGTSCILYLSVMPMTMIHELGIYIYIIYFWEIVEIWYSFVEHMSKVLKMFYAYLCGLEK